MTVDVRDRRFLDRCCDPDRSITYDRYRLLMVFTISAMGEKIHIPREFNILYISEIGQSENSSHQLIVRSQLQSHIVYFRLLNGRWAWSGPWPSLTCCIWQPSCCDKTEVFRVSSKALVTDGIILKMKIMSNRGHHPLKLMIPTYANIVAINRQHTFMRTKDSRCPAIDRIFLKEYR